jgi:hypothetical protein
MYLQELLQLFRVGQHSSRLQEAVLSHMIAVSTMFSTILITNSNWILTLLICILIWTKIFNNYIWISQMKSINFWLLMKAITTWAVADTQMLVHFMLAWIVLLCNATISTIQEISPLHHILLDNYTFKLLVIKLQLFTPVSILQM